jgi:hypothetical protein
MQPLASRAARRKRLQDLEQGSLSKIEVALIVAQRVIGIETYEVDSHLRKVAADGKAADASFMRGFIKPKLPRVISARRSGARLLQR